MFKKISLLALTSAALAFALTSCVQAPVSPVAPSLAGMWSFAGLPVATTATIDGNDVTVTVGNGLSPISMKEAYAAVTQVVVKGTLAEDAEENTFMLTLADADDAVVVSVHASVTLPALAKTVAAGIKTLITAAQGGVVMIALDSAADPDTMTVTGSFVDALLTEIELPIPATGLMATRIK